MTADPRSWIALGSVSGVGNVLFKRLMLRFGTPEEVFKAPEVEIARIEGARPVVASAIKGNIDWKAADDEAGRTERHGARIVTQADPEYPANLMEIHDPPPYLYVKGSLRPDDKVAVAMVGSRMATTYGRQITRKIARELSAKGITVVSGGARGIDSEAHRGALAGKGRTVAVLGCGIDVAYPAENAELYGLIAESGAVVSEYPMGTPPEPKNFPPRNRIISGMSVGVVVIEAAGDSGSLITASYSLEQGREVYAVPGSVVSPTSRGTNSLIKKGAKLVESANDILVDLFPYMKGYLKELDLEGAQRPPEPVLGQDEKALFGHVTLEPMHVDEIAAKSGMTTSQTLALLLGLELKGVVKQIGGMRYVREY
ncbi:MAG: DNA-protecting protein DprA [Nitrospirae bacterium]|nr:DNA-protecting protein DprA [Nitrospirota bacterium]